MPGGGWGHAPHKMLSGLHSRHAEFPKGVSPAGASLSALPQKGEMQSSSKVKKWSTLQASSALLRRMAPEPGRRIAGSQAVAILSSGSQHLEAKTGLDPAAQ